MGFFDELKKITRPYDDDYLDGYEDDPAELALEEDHEAQEAPPARPARSVLHREPERSITPRRETRPAAAPAKPAAAASTPSQVVLFKPERFETASEAADHLRERRAVVLNLELTNKDVARRLIDFLSGVAYALDGKIQKLAASTYIITPRNVDLTGDITEEIENGGLYF